MLSVTFLCILQNIWQTLLWCRNFEGLSCLVLANSNSLCPVSCLSSLYSIMSSINEEQFLVQIMNLALPLWKQTPYRVYSCTSSSNEINWLCKKHMFLTFVKQFRLLYLLNAIYCMSSNCLKIIYLKYTLKTYLTWQQNLITKD